MKSLSPHLRFFQNFCPLSSAFFKILVPSAQAFFKFLSLEDPEKWGVFGMFVLQHFCKIRAKSGDFALDLYMSFPGSCLEEAKGCCFRGWWAGSWTSNQGFSNMWTTNWSQAYQTKDHNKAPTRMIHYWSYYRWTLPQNCTPPLFEVKNPSVKF